MNADILEKIISRTVERMPEGMEFTLVPAPNIYTEDFLDITMHGKSEKFIVEYKTNPRSMHLPFLKSRNFDFGPVILIANQISTPLKEELRKAKINYLDAAGNSFINNDQIFVFIDGQKQENFKEENKNRAFSKTGLKVVFAFLLHPDMISLPYRIIAEKLKVALDTIHNVINGLKELGYIISDTEKKITLVNRRSLLNRWIQEYDIKLKPSLLIGSFRFVKGNDNIEWEKIELDGPETQWGGEPAGALITKFLRPYEFTLYTNKKRLEVMKDLKLLPDPDGKVKLYKKFWNINEDENVNVPEILVYADLLNNGDSRNVEIAKLIDEKYLQDRFK